MSNLQVMIKRLKHLEEKEKWKELSETLNKIGILCMDKGKFKDALEYHRRDKEVCEKVNDVCGQAEGIKFFFGNSYKLLRF